MYFTVRRAGDDAVLLDDEVEPLEELVAAGDAVDFVEDVAALVDVFDEALFVCLVPLDAPFVAHPVQSLVCPIPSVGRGGYGGYG